MGDAQPFVQADSYRGTGVCRLTQTLDDSNMNINEITEIDEEIFEAILDFPDEKKLVNLLIDRNLPLVLLIDVQIGNFSWQNFNISGFERIEGMCRSITGDFLVSTDTFICLCETLSWKYAIQLKNRPPDYFDFNKIKGKQRYQILRKCGFHFILESQPCGGDYALVITQSRLLLQRVIDETTI